MRRQPNWSDLKRIAHHVRCVAEAPAQREEAILRAACDLAGAPFAQLYRGELLPDGELVLATFHARGIEGKREARILQYVQDNGQDDPLIAPGLQALRESGRPVLLPRRQMISDKDFYAHPHFKNLRSEVDLDQCANAVAQLGSNRACSLAIHRTLGERAFNEFELNLLEVFWSEVSTLIGWPSLPAGGWLKDERGELLDLRGLKPDDTFEVIAEQVGLTPREREVAGWLCRGATNKEIAWELTVSPETVKRHVSAILRKTGAESRTQAAYRLKGGGHV